MRVKLAALLALVLVASGLSAQTPENWYQNQPIRSVSFDGLKSIPKSEMDGLFSSYIGKPFSDELYWEILQKMYALDYFDEITPVALPDDSAYTTVHLQFTLKEKPVLRRIAFTGNDKMRSGDLLEKVTMKEGDIYNELKARLDERAIRDFYLQSGYPGVKVTSASKSEDNGSITLEFIIEEGKQTVVSTLAFEGNHLVSAKTLRGILNLKETGILTSGYFQESLLEQDKAEIRKYYTERGYVDAAIDNVIREIDTETHPSKNLMTLTFVVREGEQYTYGGTEITGNKIFSTEELMSKIRMTEGDVLNMSRFNEGSQAIADIYFENGYTSNYFNLQEKRDTERKRIFYSITIIERERSHIERIIITGNDKTKDSVVMREFTVETGDIFSKTKLIDTLRNLYNLRYFSVVSPDVTKGSEDNLVDIVLTLEEQSTASIQFGITFSGVTGSDSFPLSIFVQWQDTNFSGNGQTLSANLTASPDTQSLTLGYTENWFLGSPLTVSFNLSLSHELLYAYQDVNGPIFDDDYFDKYGMVPDPFTSYEEYENYTSTLDTSYRMQYNRWEFGLSTSTGYRWYPNLALVTLRGGLSFGLAQNYYDDVIYRPADKGVRDEHGAWSWNNYAWTRLSLDKRDMNYDPSKGWFASQQFSLYGLIPNVEKDYFIKSDLKLEYYKTLVNVPLDESFTIKLTFAAYSSFTFQHSISQNEITDSNRLYIDGMFIGRGWSDLSSTGTGRGSLMLNHWVELRMPLAPGILAGDFYFEAVAVKDKLGELNQLTLDDYFFSYGPSLRFLIPQFPLKLVFANTFKIEDGRVNWQGADGTGPEWQFVLSFNISNL